MQKYENMIKLLFKYPRVKIANHYVYRSRIIILAIQRKTSNAAN